MSLPFPQNLLQIEYILLWYQVSSLILLLFVHKNLEKDLTIILYNCHKLSRLKNIKTVESFLFTILIICICQTHHKIKRQNWITLCTEINMALSFSTIFNNHIRRGHKQKNIWPFSKLSGYLALYHTAKPYSRECKYLWCKFGRLQWITLLQCMAKRRH